MKQILIISLLFVIIGCSSQEEKISEGMKPFMTENFPDATYEVGIEGSLHTLKISDPGNMMNKENYEPIVMKTFSEFYKIFMKSTKGADSASKFELIYENETLNWKSERFTLTQLSDNYQDYVN
ncbi:hypothetical protein [Brumimicrobium oceani]|uniref:Uncharacterized protein n=1 Tax=Brumimicrobium oceani TaxID=2100725 RepID=A0A2U2XAL3_9FLAO|nr:hypothetical protein [Brumimicrobium oceani]PWH84790.1 hypothetical protein DIT68_12730 [Brumimicrobium oceani]